MTTNPEPDRLDAIRQRHAVLAARTWEAKPHQHGASGCRCLSCYDDPTGWQIDHPSALDCEELVASTTNDFGRDRGSCDAGPLLSYEEADALAHAAEDIGFLLAAPAVVSSPPATDRATVRQQVIDALLEARRPGLGGMTEADAVAYMADAVLAVLPPTTDRAAVLLEVADWLKAWRPEFFERWAVVEQDRYEGGVDDAAAELRRMADEAQQAAAGVRQPDTETLAALIRDFLDPDPCRLDHHGYCQAHAWMCSGSPCPHGRAREVLAAIDAEQPAGGAGGVADGTGQAPPVGYSGKGRVWCLSCPRPDDEDVPVGVDLLAPYEECAGCRQDVAEVARAREEKRRG